MPGSNWLVKAGKLYLASGLGWSNWVELQRLATRWPSREAADRQARRTGGRVVRLAPARR